MELQWPSWTGYPLLSQRWIIRPLSPTPSGVTRSCLPWQRSDTPCSSRQNQDLLPPLLLSAVVDVAAEQICELFQSRLICHQLLNFLSPPQSRMVSTYLHLRSRNISGSPKSDSLSVSPCLRAALLSHQHVSLDEAGLCSRH